MRVLYLTPNFNYACGRSYYIFSIMINLVKNGFDSILVTNKGDSIDRLADNKLRYICDEKLFDRSVFKLNYQINLLSKLITYEKIDVIHTCQRFAEFIALSAIRKIKSKQVKSVFTALSNFSNRYYFEFKSDKIIGVSDVVVNNLITRYKVNPSRIIKIPNFVLEETIEPVSFSKINDDDVFRLLCVARFHSDKGIDMILKTMKILVNQKIHLTLIGEGELESKILNIIDKSKLNISLISPQRNLEKYYQSSNLCVLTSIIDPFPTFMLQAGLYKKPFIGTNISGINELIVDGENGFLVPLNKPEILARKIEEIMINSSRLNSVATNLYNEVKSKYTEKSVVPRIIKVYNSL